jgi:CHAD domain-containing protein
MTNIDFNGSTHITETGRIVLAGQLAVLESYLPDLQTETTETAVHESRKALRRTFTAFKTFAPYLTKEETAHYRHGLKKLMQRLARCRDLDVFLANLQMHADTLPDSASLVNYWRDQQTAVRVTLRTYTKKQKLLQLLHEYGEFLQDDYGFVVLDANDGRPVKTRHVAPLLIFERLVQVLAHEDKVAAAEPAQMHQLRIHFKELRYTVAFFEPLFAGQLVEELALLNTIQDHLGALNDAFVGLQFLVNTPGRETAVSAYHAHLENTANELMNTFMPLWQQFHAPAWRQAVAAAVTTLA